jgi:precorrin-3B C17-methyltransferase
MTREVERARWAIEAARGGEDTALVSRGDSGVYGMAGLVMEILEKEPPAPPLQIIPGVTAAQAAASALGTPLMCDFAVISLSDLLVSWDTIRLRLEKVAAADLVTVLYNPKSRKRERYIVEARDIFLCHRSPSTPVGIVRQASMADQRVIMSDLAHFTERDIDMLTTVVIGGSMTAVVGAWMITRRGYDL